MGYPINHKMYKCKVCDDPKYPGSTRLHSSRDAHSGKPLLSVDHSPFAPYMIIGLTVMTYIHWSILGLQSQLLPHRRLQAVTALVALPATVSICLCHRSSLSRIIPRYLISDCYWKMLWFNDDVFMARRFLLRINGITVVLVALMFNHTGKHHCSIILRPSAIGNLSFRH